MEKHEGIPDSVNPTLIPHAISAAAPSERADPDDLRGWLAGNWFSLLFMLLVGGWLFYTFQLNWDSYWSILKAALGLSFVIFIHELGHFLVAKWCDVHVTTFSIGFGPAFPGCWFVWGETTYKLSIFPLGGYVQMVGQVDGDEGSDGSEEDPRSYRAKSVWQRMAIISAGVVMNVVLAILCFIVVFEGPGKDRMAAVVDAVDTNAPAFRQGIRTGAAIEHIGGIDQPTFDELRMAVMNSTDGEKIPFAYRLQGQDAVSLDVEPRLEKTDMRPVIGIQPPNRLMLATRRYLDPTMPVPAYANTSAAKAAPALDYGDRVVGTTDPDDPAKIKDLPDDPRYPGKGQADFFEFDRRMQQLAGQPVVLRVERELKGRKERVDVAIEPSYRHSLGVRMQMGNIVVVREGTEAAKELRAGGSKSKGDLVQGVSVKEADGKATEFKDSALDPERLPHELRLWADRLAKAKAPQPWEVTLHVLRHRDQPGEEYEKATIKLKWDNAWRFDKAVPMSPSAPLAIPELGFAYQINPAVAEVLAKDSPFKVGDVVKNLRYTLFNNLGEEKTTAYFDDELQPGQWAVVGYRYLQTPSAITKFKARVEREKKIEEIDVTPTADKAWPLADRGWILMPDMRRQKAGSVGEAVTMGFKDTKSNMVQVFQNLRGMFTGRVSPKNLGGPVMIATAAYRIAGVDLWEFVFFLGLISINLAVVNFLPIPVLDGGHMVFLIYEKLRGQPASEGVRIGATYAGLAMILSLMVFVLYLDMTRLFQ